MRLNVWDFQNALVNTTSIEMDNGLFQWRDVVLPCTVGTHIISVSKSHIVMSCVGLAESLELKYI
jgi:hypothetical protein